MAPRPFRDLMLTAIFTSLFQCGRATTLSRERSGGNLKMQLIAELADHRLASQMQPFPLIGVTVSRPGLWLCALPPWLEP